MELDAITSLLTQVSSLANMTTTLKRPVAVQEMKTAKLIYVYCREDHVFDECLLNPTIVYYMRNFNQNNNPYSNMYNPWWNNIPTAAGVIEDWEIPVMLPNRMSQVHHLDIINSCHEKMFNKV
ncbi:hypothetical protein PVK06_001874 [Gossypium arboreum]|uniref:Uncharacterized protein n=1 Tax=Gossypium arboreum TaxID=29729 RepID=A0ABR0R251_GOSAR|nr:hypothetical protein PVK06_001874 [Gossypium arboreum]